MIKREVLIINSPDELSESVKNRYIEDKIVEFKTGNRVDDDEILNIQEESLDTGLTKIIIFYKK